MIPMVSKTCLKRRHRDGFTGYLGPIETCQERTFPGFVSSHAHSVSQTLLELCPNPRHSGGFVKMPFFAYIVTRPLAS